MRKVCTAAGEAGGSDSTWVSMRTVAGRGAVTAAVSSSPGRRGRRNTRMGPLWCIPASWLPDRAGLYRNVARETLKALMSDFLSPGGVLLHGSWGRMRHVEAGKPRLGRFPQEDIMPYGNYWIAECLFRALSDDWSVLSLNAKN